MTYDRAVKTACQNAINTGRDWYVTENENGCSVTDDESQYASTIYIAEPCYESQVIGA